MISLMMSWKKQAILLLVISLIFTIAVFKEELKKLFITDFEEEGRYFSRQFDISLSNVNTLDYKKIGVREEISQDKVTYRFNRKADEKIVIRVLKGVPFGDKNISDSYENLSSVQVSIPGSIILKRNAKQLSTGNNQLRIPQNSFSNSKELSIQLIRADGSEAIIDKQVIRRIEVSFLPYNGDFLPNLPLILMYASLPVLFYFILLWLKLPEKIAFILGLIFIPLIYMLRYFSAGFQLQFLLNILYLFSFVILLLSLKDKRGLTYFFAFLFILLIIQAVYLRWQELEFAAFAPPHPDAGRQYGYKALADNLKFPFSGIFSPGADLDQHERMYPFIVKIFFSIFGSSDLHIRFVSMFFSTLIVILGYFLVAEMVRNRFLGLLAMFALAINWPFIENSVYGVRTEVECFLLMLFFYIGFLKKDFIKLWIWAIILGLCASLLVLVRGFYLIPILFLMGYFMIRYKKALKSKVLPFLLSILLIIVPFICWRIQIHKKHHSWTWDQEVYTRVTAYIEFEDVSLLSKKITPKEYFLKMHSPTELVSSTIVGLGGAIFLLNEYSFNIVHLQNSFLKEIFTDKFMAIKNNFSTFVLIALTLLISYASFLYVFINKERRAIFWIVVLSLYYSSFFIGIFFLKRKSLISIDRAILPLLPFFIMGIICFLQRLGTSLFKKRSLLKIG